MKQLISALLTLLSLTASIQAGKLDFSAAGFRIPQLYSGDGTLPTQPLMLFLPVSDGFAPSVNVQIQDFPGSIQEYVELSFGQFASNGLKILNHNLKESKASFEYSGALQGMDLHFYALAEKHGSKVYLVTGTAKSTQWDAVSKEIKNCVDGFELTSP